MSDHYLPKAAFFSLVDTLIREGPVVGVKARGAAFAFERLDRADELRLDYGVTLLPPKLFLQPVREELLRFTRGDTPSATPVHEDQPLVLVGVHPYDLAAINQMDVVFTEDHADEHYLRRRANTTIIASNIQKAGPKSFADQMGTTRVTRGFDLFVTDIGAGFVATGGTDKGQALLKRAAGVTAPTSEMMKKREAALAAADKLYGENRLEFPQSRAADLLRPDPALDHPVWEEKSRKCYSCGSCNLVCPTCYCFDVRDEVSMDLKEGVRYRTWDGCLLNDFALVASGENFRHQRVRRFQHRFYRKFLYLFDRFKTTYCVGCGRCATACLPDIANPVAVLNALSHGKEQS